jgi:hypothetical protein
MMEEACGGEMLEALSPEGNWPVPPQRLKSASDLQNDFCPTVQLKGSPVHANAGRGCGGG